jgi:hypothetical protein
LRVVLDTCILKLATFPAEDNASALIYTEFLNVREVGRLVKKLVRG